MGGGDVKAITSTASAVKKREKKRERGLRERSREGRERGREREVNLFALLL